MRQIEVRSRAKSLRFVQNTIDQWKQTWLSGSFRKNENISACEVSPQVLHPCWRRWAMEFQHREKLMPAACSADRSQHRVHSAVIRVPSTGGTRRS